VLEGLPKRREASRRRGPPATPARPREPFGAGAPDGSRAPVLACINVGIALNEHTEAEGATVFRQACAMGLEDGNGLITSSRGPRHRSIRSRRTNDNATSSGDSADTST
jgi:hypothetical protein